MGSTSATGRPVRGEAAPSLEQLAKMRCWTPQGKFPPSTPLTDRVFACGGGIYLISNPRWAEGEPIYAVGWAESDYWAQLAWPPPFRGDLKPPPPQWDQVPLLEFLGKPEDLSFGSVRAFEQAREGARKATLVTASYRISIDGAFLYVEVKGANAVLYKYGSNKPKAKDMPVAVEIELPGEPAEEIVLYHRPGAPPLD